MEPEGGGNLRHTLLLTLLQGTHPRLGERSPLRLLDQGACCDLVSLCLRFVPVLLPDHAPTLRQAIDMAPEGGTVIVRKGEGEHLVGARVEDEILNGRNESGETYLEVEKGVTLVGEEGAVLRGMLILRAEEGGVIRGLKIQDAGDCSVKVEKGSWEIEGCFLLCGHACAVRAEGSSHVRVRECRLGGEGRIGRAVAEYYDLPRTWIDTMGSVQEYGLQKNACYGIFVKDDAHVAAQDCEISFCSESALFLRDRGAADILRCALVESGTAFTAGWGCGRALEVSACSTKGVGRLWFDEDRPARCSEGICCKGVKGEEVMVY